MTDESGLTLVVMRLAPAVDICIQLLNMVLWDMVCQPIGEKVYPANIGHFKGHTVKLFLAL
jgi:hypothetical protein